MKKQTILNIILVAVLASNTMSIRKANQRLDETQTVVISVIQVVNAIVEFLQGGK